MKTNQPRYESIDDYIKRFPKDVQKKLEELRTLIARVAPDAEERISYQMPAFYLKGNLVYFAAFSQHIGFYPTSSGVEKFRTDLSRYPTSKGAIRFSLKEPLPLDLIRRIVEFRVKENTNGRDEHLVLIDAQFEKGMTKAFSCEGRDQDIGIQNNFHEIERKTSSSVRSPCASANGSTLFRRRRNR